MKPGRRLVLVALTLVMLPLCLLICTAGWLTYSENGLKKIAQYASHTEPRLTLSGPTGHLFGNVTFKSIRWRQTNIDVELINPAADFSPLCLFAVTVCATKLTANTVYIRTFPDDSSAKARIDLANITLPFGVFVSEAKIQQLTIERAGRQQFSSHDIRFRNLSWDNSTLSFSHLDAMAFAEKFSAKGRLTLNEDYPLKVDLSLSPTHLEFLEKYLIDRPANDTPFKATIAIEGTLRALRSRFQLQGPMALTGTASIKPLDRFFPFSLNATLNSKTQIAGAGTAIAIEASEFVVNGDTNGLNFSLLATALLPGIDNSSTLEISGSSDYASLEFQQARLNTSQGDITALGRLIFDDARASHFALAGTNINTEIVNPKIAAKLNLSADITIETLFSEPLVTASLSAMEGQFLNHPLATKGTVTWRSDSTISFQQWQLRSDVLAVKIDGEYPGKQLRWSGSVNQLGHMLPGTQGQLTASGQLSGTVEKPNIDADMHLTDFEFGSFSARKFDGDINIKQLGWLPSSLSVRGEGIAVEGVEQDISLLLSLNAKQIGNTQQVYDYFLLGDALQSTITLTATRQNAWQTVIDCNPVMALTSFNIDLTCPRVTLSLQEQTGTTGNETGGTPPEQQADTKEASPNQSLWENDHPLRASWQQAEKRLGIDSFCIDSGESSLCLQEQLSWNQKTKPSLALHGDKLPLGWLSSYTPDDYTVQGHWQFDANLAEIAHSDPDAADSDWRLQGTISTQHAALTKQLPNDKSMHLAIDTLETRFLASRQSFNSTFELSSNTLGTVDGNLAYEQQSLTGSVKANQLDASIMQALIPNTRSLTGHISTDITFDLSSQKPRVFGDIQLHDMTINSPALPFLITANNTQLQFKEQAMDILGTMKIGGGNARIDGQANWANEHWSSRINLTGQDLVISPLARSTIKLAPNLVVVGGPGQLMIEGDIAIPEAYIEVQSLPHNALLESDDTVIDGKLADSNAMTLSSNINAVFGKHVKFRGFGLDTRLEGQLRIRTRPYHMTTGNGVVSLYDGHYQAYGQNLIIEEGRMIFNGPLANPELLVTATRNYTDGDIRVGVQVTGPAKNAQIAVFSNPAKPESEMISYLLTGKSPKNTSVDESRMAQQMAISMSLAQTNKAARDIAESLGVDDFRMGTSMGKNGDEAQFSGYVAPDLYLQYGVSMFDRSSSITARYQVSPRVYVEMYSGATSAIDVFWSLIK